MAFVWNVSKENHKLSTEIIWVLKDVKCKSYGKIEVLCNIAGLKEAKRIIYEKYISTENYYNSHLLNMSTNNTSLSHLFF